VETFSPYTRQFLERMDKPKVDAVRHPASVAIDERVKDHTVTVFSITRINDAAVKKLLGPRIAQAILSECEHVSYPPDGDFHRAGDAHHPLMQRVDHILAFQLLVRTKTFFEVLPKQQGKVSAIRMSGRVHRVSRA